MFSCYDDKTTDIYNDIWKGIEENWNYRPIVRENNGTLEKAMQLAMKAHRGFYEEETNEPYILHLIETLQILTAMDADTNLMAAGILHHTLENTDVKILDIYEQFGVDVAALVNCNTEDKGKIWYVRKLTMLKDLSEENIRQKMLCLADNVANLRSWYREYKRIGDELWHRFDAPKGMQSWYCSTFSDAVCELQNYPETADIYCEMTDICKNLMGMM